MGYGELARKIKDGYNSLKRKPVFKYFNITWNQKSGTAEIIKKEAKMDSMKKENHKDEDLEFTDSMIERMDEMDQAVYQMCLTLLELENEGDFAKRFPWDRHIVEEIKESAIWILNKNQYRVCYPFIEEEEGNREFCGLDSCGLSECVRHP